MIDIQGGHIGASDRQPGVIRTDTNTTIIPLEEDEVLALIAELARSVALGGPGYLVIEQEWITHAKRVPSG